MDFALIAQAATLEARVPFLHFFDGFRTSHEVMKIEQLTDDDMRAMIDDELVRAHRAPRPLAGTSRAARFRAESRRVLPGARDGAIRTTTQFPAIVQKAMDKFASIVGRQYKLFEYVGSPDCGARHRDHGLGCRSGTGDRRIPERTRREHRVPEGPPLPTVRRPSCFVQCPSATVKAIAVLDRTKEPGAAGEPLYQDVITAIAETLSATAPAPFKTFPKIVGGTVRPLLEGVHPGDGQGRVSTN